MDLIINLTSQLGTPHIECFIVRVLISSIMGEDSVFSTGVCWCFIHEGKRGKWFSYPALGIVKESNRGKRKRPNSHALTIIIALLDLLRGPVYQYIQRPNHTGDGDDMECDRAEYSPPFTRGHL